jgi:hypothetical protein
MRFEYLLLEWILLRECDDKGGFSWFEYFPPPNGNKHWEILIKITDIIGYR